MSSQPTTTPELADCIKRFRTIVKQEVQLVNGLILVSMGQESARKIRTENKPVPLALAQALPLWLQALGSSSVTIIKLSDSPGLQTRDCYSIARSIFEIAVNICYVLASGPAEAERALRHARQKSFKDLHRESRINDAIFQIKFSRIPDISDIVGLETEIAEFTSKAGREKAWIDLSVEKRIAAIGLELGGYVQTALQGSMIMVYRHSSEILHGSLFGALFFFGLTSPNNRRRTPNEAMEQIAEQHMLILYSVALAHAAVVESFHKTIGFSRAQEQSRKLMASIGEIPYLKEKDNLTPTD